jgi:hypothetical protein
MPMKPRPATISNACEAQPAERLFSRLAALRNRWPAAYTAANAVYLLLLIAYVAILFFGPRVDTKSGLEFQVGAQKIIVYASVINLGLQAVSVHFEARHSSRQRRGNLAA